MLTHENYHSLEMNTKYWGSSSYKHFAGCPGIPGCETAALATMRGEWEDLTTEEKKAGGKKAFKLGHYLDAAFTGDIDLFVARHPEIISTRGETKGQLKADYRHADDVIERLREDQFFMDRLIGEKQKIFTGEMFGVQWKICLDCYLKGVHITDFKYMAEINKRFWVKDTGTTNYIDFYGYDIQAAIYQEIVYINTGERLPFYHAVADKTNPYPNYAIIQIPDELIKDRLMEIESNMPRLMQVKSGELEPDRCGDCNYCIKTKRLDRAIMPNEIQPGS